MRCRVRDGFHQVSPTRYDRMVSHDDRSHSNIPRFAGPLCLFQGCPHESFVLVWHCGLLPSMARLRSSVLDSTQITQSLLYRTTRYDRKYAARSAAAQFARTPPTGERRLIRDQSIRDGEPRGERRRARKAAWSSAHSVKDPLMSRVTLRDPATATILWPRTATSQVWNNPTASPRVRLGS